MAPALVLQGGREAAAASALDPAGADVELVSVAHDGGEADGLSELEDFDRRTWGRAISSTGRFVLFVSEASNLVAGGTAGTRGVFVRDRAAGSTRLVAAGQYAQLSDDGRVVVYQGTGHGSPCEHEADGFHPAILVEVDGDVEVVTPRTLDTDETCWGEGQLPAVSGDGSTVAFSSANDWVAGQRGETRDSTGVYAHDLGSGSYELVVGLPPDNGQQQLFPLHLQLDADGDTLLFTGRGPFTADTPADDGVYAYVHDRSAGSTQLVSRDTDGRPVPVRATDLSADGRHVAFVHAALLNDPDPEAYVHDLDTGTSTLMSVDSAGAPLEGGDVMPLSIALSADGQLVGFVWSPDLDPSVFLVRDRLAQVTWQVEGVQPTANFDLSDDGRVLTFETGREVEAATFCFPEGFGTGAQSRSPQQGSTCPAGDPELIAFEVTQGIQNLAQDVELIPGRRTWVRAHVRSTAGEIEDVGARIRVSRGHPSEGLLGVLTPANGGGDDATTFEPQPPGTIDLYASPQRSDLSAHYVFELPRDWASGLLAIEFEGTARIFACRDGGHDCRVNVFFPAAPDPPVEVELTYLSWTDDNGRTHRPTATHFRRAVHQLRALLPISELRFAFGGVLFADGDPATSSLTRFLASVAARVHRSQAGCTGGLSDACYVGLMFASPSTGTGTVDGVVYTPLGSGTADVFLGRAPRFGSLTLAHELGHAAGREHVDTTGTSCTQAAGPYEPYPFAGGQLGTSLAFPPSATGYEANLDPETTYWGTDVYRYVGSNGMVAHPSTFHDLMTYCDNVWTSPVVWQRIRDVFATRFAALLPQASAATAQADLVVAGTLAAGTGTIEEVWTADGPVFGTRTDGELTLRLHDGSGATLDTLGVDELVGDDDGAFVAAVPAGADVRRIDLLRGTTVLDSVVASASAPTVDLDAPSGGASGEEVTVRWTAGDPDGDPLRVRVDYSPDGGATWMPAAIHVQGDAFTLATGSLPGSTDARARVRASDGFWTGEAVSPRFTLADGPPMVVVDVPQPFRYLPGQQVVLDVVAQDREDGPLDGDAVVWASDRDGPLGTGSSLEVPVSVLSFGRHRITATATDSAGASVSDTATIDIAPITLGARRLWGSTRIETAVEVSRADFAGDGAASAVVLSRSDVFADALAGTPLAVRADGPLLLTPPTALADATERELVRVLPPGGTVYLLGGSVALSTGVESRLEELGFETVRLGGGDRYETALRIATEGLGDPELLLLADGVGFPDALAAGAAAGALDGAVLLTRDDQLPASTAGYLADRSEAVAYAVGGPAARAAPDATPLSGPTRYETALEVARTLLPDALVVGLASGATFPDALSGGAHVGRLGGPVLLTRPDELPATVADGLAARAGRVSAGYVYGGVAALTDAVASAFVDTLG